MGSLHHHVFVYATKGVHSSVSSMQMSYNPAISCNSTQERLVVHRWRKYQEHNPRPLWKKISSSSPGTVSVLHSNCRTHSSFSPKTIFLSVLYPIQQNICTSNQTPDYSTLKVQLWQYPYFKEFRYPEAVNSILLLWFFTYIPHTSNNEQAEMNQIIVGKKYCNKSR